MQIIKIKQKEDTEATKIPNDVLNNLGLSWGAMGLITTLFSYKKKLFMLDEIKTFSYMDSDYKVKKYLSELVEKKILSCDKKTKMYKILPRSFFIND